MQRIGLNNRDVINYTLLFLSGLICLLIYLFYRSGEIMLNHYLLSVFPNLILVKESVKQWLPLNDFLVYNLPAGLWVFSLTILLKDVSLHWLSCRFSLHTVPLGLGLSIELLQFLQLTDGTCDLLDVYTMLICFLVAQLFRANRPIEVEPRNLQSMLASMGIVILFLGNRW